MINPTGRHELSVHKCLLPLEVANNLQEWMKADPKHTGATASKKYRAFVRKIRDPAQTAPAASVVPKRQKKYRWFRK